MKIFKGLLLITGLCFISLGTFAQAELNKKLQLTGSGSDAKIEGIDEVTGAKDATSVEVIQAGGLIYALATGGAGNAFVVTLSPAISGYQTGMIVNFKADAAITGATTINVNSLGAKTIKKEVNTDLVAGDIKSGQMVSVSYDGSNFQLVGVSGGSGGDHPSMTEAQRDAIATPAAGMVIYNTTTNCLNFYNSTVWCCMCEGPIGCGIPSTPGAITGNNTPVLGESETYSVTPVTAATGYTWTFPGVGWTITDDNGNSVTVTIGANSGNITVTADNACGSSSASSLSVTVQVSKTVFVTSASYNGNLGGVSGADAKCTTAATNASLTGTYKAWISVYAAGGGSSPSTTFTQSAAPYKLVNGTTVADDWADLTDGSLDNPINIDENGNSVGGTQPVWTQTTVNGTFNDDNCCCAGGWHACGDWTNSSSGTSYRGQYGFTDKTDTEWTDYENSSVTDYACNGVHECRDCNCTQRLYCFEQ